VPFKELDKNPLETLEKIYDAFEFLSSEAEEENEKNKKEKYKGSHAEKKAKAYIESAAMQNFKKNAFVADLSVETKREINRRWQKWFRLFGYTDDDNVKECENSR